MLIVLEGMDGCGKSTQLELLCRELEEKGLYFRRIAFPRYENESSAMVRRYLNGGFGKKADGIGPYAASAFFAVDRFASFLEDWKPDREAGIPIICDRYTTSNIIYQGGKLPPEERDEFARWLFDFEYKRAGLPAPDKVIFLDLSPELSAELRRRRNGPGDIHENDQQYLSGCRDAALNAAREFGWEVIDCAPHGELLSIDEIHGMIMEKVGELPSPKELKAVLRRSVRKERRENPATAEENAGITENILSMPEYAGARSIFCYMAAGGEADLSALMKDALARGKRVFVPHTMENGIMEPVELLEGDRLVPRMYGIAEPEILRPGKPSDMDMAVIPGLACTPEGVRLGQGGGYYDRFLAEFKGSCVMACPERFVYVRLPHEPHDYRVPLIATESTVIR